MKILKAFTAKAVVVSGLGTIEERLEPVFVVRGSDEHFADTLNFYRDRAKHHFSEEALRTLHVLAQEGSSWPKNTANGNVKYEEGDLFHATGDVVKHQDEAQRQKERADALEVTAADQAAKISELTDALEAATAGAGKDAKTHAKETHARTGDEGKSEDGDRKAGSATGADAGSGHAGADHGGNKGAERSASGTGKGGKRKGAAGSRKRNGARA